MPDTPPPLTVGLGEWRCRLCVDTWDGYARLLRVCGDVLTEDGPAASTLALRLEAGPYPIIRWRRNAQPGDFAPLFAGPEGKRFVPVASSEQRRYTDTTAGADPALELCGDTLHVLRPRAWPTYLLHVLTWLMLREQPLLALHAAVCAVRGVALLLIGPSGCGKSTLSYALACRGADYFTDEAAFLHQSSGRLFVWPQRLGLRPGGMAALETALPDAAWTEAKPNDLKCLPDLPKPQSPCPENRSVLLFINGFGESPRIAPIGGGEAARRLAFVMGCADPSPLARLEAAADAVSRHPCRALTIGHPEETAARLIASADEMAQEAAWRKR